jgi:glycosyltransferase involved in cell wall biosynthesis
MRICRVVKYLPSAAAHPGGLHAYFFTKYIAEPTLILAKAEPAAAWLPLPAHALARPIAYRDVPFMTAAGAGGHGRWRRRLEMLARGVLKVGELAFVVQAVPPLVRFRPDVVHVHGLLALGPGLFAKAWLGAALVVTIHSATDVRLARRSRLVRRLLRAADRVLCVAPPLRDGLVGCVEPRRLAVLPSAFDPSIFRDLGRPRAEQLVAVGALKWQKGYDDLLAAMVLVRGRRPGVQLVIAGEGPERARLQRLIERLGLADDVTLVGAVPQAEIARLLNESRLFVMASVSEGLPKAVLEAVACGTPIVVTEACNVSDLAGRVGAVVPPGDPAALAEAIVTLLADEPRRRALAARCAETAETYDWQTVAARVAAVYREVRPAA